MKNISVFAGFVLATLCTTSLFAHGEDKPGPHGGFIRMPGAFHTEVMAEKAGLRIMLLDINFQNPTVEDSSVKVTLKADNKEILLKCKTDKDSFFCPMTGHLREKKGILAIQPMRHKAKGAQVEYPFPLQQA